METLVTPQVAEEHLREEKKTAEVIFGGAVGEELLAAGTVVLTIIALTGRRPELFLPVATIVLGAALLFEGSAISLRLYNLLSETARNRMSKLELSIGTTVEPLAGCLAIGLGILALLRLHPMILVPAAIVVIGTCLILEAGANISINALRLVRIEKPEKHPFLENITRQVVWAATEIQVLAGIGGVVLGILALSGIAPMILSLTALLSMSGAALLSGTAISGRMLKLFET